MARLRRQHRVAACCLLFAATGLALGQEPPHEFWVVTESSQIFVIDPVLLSVGSPIDISDPTITGLPASLTFSQVQGQPQQAFVTQGKFLRRIDVASRTVLFPSIDVAALVGVPDLTLRGCEASITRELSSVAGAVPKSYLHLAATLPSGEARYVILDQEQVLIGSTAALVDSGSLHPQATALGVTVLESPAGDRFLRAWYTLARAGTANNEILAVPVDLGPSLGVAASVGPARIRSFPSTDPLPDVLKLGAPFERELPVMPDWSLGSLTNLDTGDACPLGGDLSVVSVSGPGPNSYTVLALDPSANQLLIVGPNDCSATPISVGQKPVDVVPLGILKWRGAFVVNHDSDSVTFVDKAGAATQIPLGLGTAPVAGGVASQLLCSVFNFKEQTIGNDIELTWSSLCQPGKTFFVWCSCVDDPLNCDCACDCSVPDPDEACACPPDDGALALGGGNFLINYPPDDEISKNPWRKLGSTVDQEFTHAGHADNGPDWNYAATTTDEPPPGP